MKMNGLSWILFGCALASLIGFIGARQSITNDPISTGLALLSGGGSSPGFFFAQYGALIAIAFAVAGTIVSVVNAKEK